MDYENLSRETYPLALAPTINHFGRKRRKDVKSEKKKIWKDLSSCTANGQVLDSFLDRPRASLDRSGQVWTGLDRSGFGLLTHVAGSRSTILQNDDRILHHSSWIGWKKTSRSQSIHFVIRSNYCRRKSQRIFANSPVSVFAPILPRAVDVSTKFLSLKNVQ